MKISAKKKKRKENKIRKCSEVFQIINGGRTKKKIIEKRNQRKKKSKRKRTEKGKRKRKRKRNSPRFAVHVPVESRSCLGHVQCRAGLYKVQIGEVSEVDSDR